MTLKSQQYADLMADSYLDPVRGADGRYENIARHGITYKVLGHVDQANGYQGTIYQRADTGEIVVAHRGTEFDRQPLQDGGLADGGMVFGRVNAQADDAILLTERALEIANKIGKDKGYVPQVAVTGHSLGGALAQVAAHHFGLYGEAFNPYGAVSLGMRIPEGGDRFVNHVMAADVVSAASGHYGQVRYYATEREIETLRHLGATTTRPACWTRAIRWCRPLRGWTRTTRTTSWTSMGRDGRTCRCWTIRVPVRGRSNTRR